MAKKIKTIKGLTIVEYTAKEQKDNGGYKFGAVTRDEMEQPSGFRNSEMDFDTLNSAVEFAQSYHKNPSTAEYNRCRKMLDKAKDEPPTITYHWKTKNPKGHMFALIDTKQKVIARSKDIDKLQNRADRYNDKVGKVELFVVNESDITKKNDSHSDFRAFKKTRLAELSAMFQGKESQSNIRALQPNISPKELYRLGHLVLLVIKHTDTGKKIDIEFDGNSLLAGDIRNNLWIVGSDARITDVTRPKGNDLKEIGTLTRIEYVTAKKHIENGQKIRFWHPLGEVDKQYPKLFIDSDGFPIIVAGGYDVWDVGIVN